MKTTSLLMLTALAAASTAMAQPGGGDRGGRRPPPPQGPQGPPPMVQPFFALLDTDRDGVLSAAEVKAASSIIAKSDKNNDGVISIDELHPQGPPPKGDDKGKNPDKPKGPPPMVPPVIAALDTDHNGTISASELEGASESLKELDKNNDGELTPDELHPQGPPRDGPQGPPNGPPEGPPPGDGPLEGVE